MSSRARDIAAKTAELGLSSSKARQGAAWGTKAARNHAVDQFQLFDEWDSRLTALGCGSEVREHVLGRVKGPESLNVDVKEKIFLELVRSDGLGEHTAIFDRRGVVQRLADLISDRLPADSIDELADELLVRPEVVELEPASRGEEISQTEIQRSNGQRVSMKTDRLYSTEAMLSPEQRALSSYERGHTAGSISVAAELVDEVLGREEFARLTQEQRAFVTLLTTSLMRIKPESVPQGVARPPLSGPRSRSGERLATR